MASLWLALLPSLQDQNVVSNPAPGGPTREKAQMDLLCDDFEAELRTTFAGCGITWKRIVGRPYSASTYDLQTLYEQTRAARAWLDGSPAGVPSVSYNLHSDAPAAGTPGVSHVGARVDSRGTHAEAITKAICPAIASVFKTTRVMYFDGTDYVFAKELATSPHVPLLIEHGDHTVAADNLTLATKGREVARAAIGAILAHYGIAIPEPTPEPAIPQDVLEYIAARPSLGGVKLGAGLNYKDSIGRWIVTTTTGAVVVRRSFDPPGEATVQIEHIDWLADPKPVDRDKVMAALDAASVGIASAKAALG